jgi:cytochrome c oxidase subunit 2
MTALSPPIALPPNASVDGGRVDALFGLTAQLAGGCLFVVLVVLVALLWRYRARPGHRAQYQTGATRAHALGVAGLAIFTFVLMDVSLARRAHADLSAQRTRLEAARDALRIEVMPARFSWNVRYAGGDGRFVTADDAIVLDEMRVPVNVPVVVQLAPRDVIHSFFVPAFRVKQDAIPGRVTHTFFEANHLGTFEIACAQLCGFGHYRMRAVLHVVPRVEFDAWLTRVSDDSMRRYIDRDAESHWGWPWQE